MNPDAGRRDQRKVKQMYDDFKEKFNNGEVDTLKNYDYSAHRVKDPSKIKGPDRLLSYHAQSGGKLEASAEFDLDDELNDIFQFQPTKTEIAPPKAKLMALDDVKKVFDTELSKENAIDTFKDAQIPIRSKLQKKSYSQHMGEQKAKNLPTASALYLGSIEGTFRYNRTPRPLPNIGDSFKGLRPKVQPSTAVGKFKLSKNDYRRYLVEVKGDDNLIMGYLDDHCNGLLSSLIDLGVVEVWVTLIDLPKFTTPFNESVAAVEVYLLTSALSPPIITPVSKQEEEEKDKFGQVKDKMIQLIRTIEGSNLIISQDVATKPLKEWKVQNRDGSNPFFDKDPASIDLIDSDNRVQLFIDKDLNDAGVMESAKDPEHFSKELHLMDHQRHALSWLKMREGVKGYSAPSTKMFDSEIHPMWCELQVDLNNRLNSGFKEELCSLTEFINEPSHFKVYFNPYSGQLSQTLPGYGEEMKNFKGGILADEMGLGKTVMMIALLLSHRLKDEQIYMTEGPDNKKIDQVELGSFDDIAKTMSYQKQTTSKKQRVFMSTAHFRHCVLNNTEPGLLMDTLIVVPTSLSYQWRDEIQKFSAVKIKILVYSEDEKIDMFEDIRNFDIVIVSYNKLSYDFKSGKSKIHQAYWFRIVLDEAHYIRNRRTQLSKSICALRGDRRWCLSGTPIQNSMDDLFALVAFMQYAPWSDYHWWNQNINLSLQDPTKKDKALKLMNTILRPLMLRRTKQQHQSVLGLKFKTICVANIDLTVEERERYDSYYLKSKKTFQDLIRQGNLNNCYIAIWPMIMKLRQLCDHYVLTKSKPKSAPADTLINNLLKQIEKRTEDRKLMQAELTEEDDEVTKKKGREGRAAALKFERDKYRKWIESYYYSRDSESTASLKDSSASQLGQVNTNCPICLTDDLENPIVTTCGHFGCLPCMQNWLSNNRTCPYCSFVLRKEDLFDIPIE